MQTEMQTQKTLIRLLLLLKDLGLHCFGQTYLLENYIWKINFGLTLLEMFLFDSLMSLYMSRVMRKPAFCICINKDADQLCSYSAFVFATWIVLFLYFLNPKFQASRHILWLYSPVCVGPGRKPRRPVFSQLGSLAGTLIAVSWTVDQRQVCHENPEILTSTYNLC